MDSENSTYRALWSAVLLTALNDCKLRDAVNKKKCDDPREFRRWAKAWIRYQGDEPQTFNWICEMLQVSAEALRTYALEPKAQLGDNLDNIRPVRFGNGKKRI